MKVLVLSSLAYSLTNFRGALLKEMRQRGHVVVAAAPDRDAKVEEWLAGEGISFRLTPMQRTGTNPFSDLRLLWSYVRLMREEKPDLVLAYTQKPIIFGGLAARISRITLFYALMSGLGHVFSAEASHAGWFPRLVARLYREGLRKVKAVFVFNADDRADMIGLGIVKPSQRVIQVPGSGVDLGHFTARSLPDGKLSFLLVGRLMRDKGIFEFLEAARLLHAECPHCEFSILGRYETENPTGLDQRQCDEIAAEYPVRFIPGTDDVRPFLAACSVFVLPSFYREGLPRTILEAMATGRAIITTDMPGCRDPIEDGANGFLVAPHDAESLLSAMRQFVGRPELAAVMGLRSRQIAESTYDVHKVNKLLLNEMGLMGPAPQVPTFGTNLKRRAMPQEDAALPGMAGGKG
jgi:glycosyltransferase involved in cell wall biosynthesis